MPLLGVESAEVVVVRGADEYESREAVAIEAALAGTAGLLLLRRKTFGDAQGHAPSYIAGVDVHRHQFTPRRLAAEHAGGGVAETAAGTDMGMRAGAAARFIRAHHRCGIDGAGIRIRHAIQLSPRSLTLMKR